MEFKYLPPSIQEIAAHTLRHRLNELELESVTKKDTDNMARNVRDAFTGLFSDTALNIHGTEDTAKQFAESSKSQKQPNNHEINELLLATGFININEYERRKKMLSDQSIKISF
ncbi:TPA: hypothetical protein PPE16_003278 [Escherichia coli]|nr:hypothetical protein [Escherichia coli]